MKYRSLLKKRETLLPEEYPELIVFLDAINNSMWFPNKWDFVSDKNDYDNLMTEGECSISKKTMLAIAQVEIKVKRFWVELYHLFPKPEIDAIGVSFGESEVRHQRGYRKPIEKFGLEEEFAKLEQEPVIKNRLDYLNKYLDKVRNTGNIKDKLMVLTLFTLAVENSSLFGLFSIIKVINQKRKVLKDTDNLIMDTTKEENIHALFGIYLINLLKEENPELFPEDFEESVKALMEKAYEAESNIIDWVFDEYELPYLNKEEVKTYIKFRINYSLELLNIEPIFEIDESHMDKFEFFELEQSTTIHVDFFHKSSPNYNKFSREASEDDLF